MHDEISGWVSTDGEEMTRLIGRTVVKLC